MRRFIRACAACLCCVALAATGSCAPHGHAVGDTQSQGTYEQNHNENAGSRLKVAVIGSSSDDAKLDKQVMNALSDKRFDASYTSMNQYSSDAERAARLSQRAVEDAVACNVKIIVLSEFTFAGSTEQTWDSVLSKARNAGIPVVLLDPIDEPKNTLLFAATFTVNNKQTDAVEIGKALQTVIFDNPHERAMTVTTLKPSE
ncbi:sugar ABC transporter substrate-binding protein [Bifidobacterium canis]|uniref:ABC-type sugar transport system, periplasmic component n=1 Tax=Bifidobacterium canis TaxID=2610880 RepID=A0A7K1J314_9BIFI|nr:sugar ABC transporter substrate-binding protein [Bifidobacterium canis]MUH58855.1 ABC-type sugar transport system, periplasmic component [Bifidobacterium canis]